MTPLTLNERRQAARAWELLGKGESLNRISTRLHPSIPAAEVDRLIWRWRDAATFRRPRPVDSHHRPV